MPQVFTEPAIIIGIDHIQLAMPKGLEQSAEHFYSVLLGFEKVQKPSQLEKRGGCWFRSGSVNLHLGVDPEFIPARKAHPGFLVSNLRAIGQRLRDFGIEIVWDMQISGFERFYASDPFGNRLEFLERVDSAETEVGAPDNARQR